MKKPSLSAAVVQAERDTPREMWDARRDQPLVERVIKVAGGIALHNPALRNYARKRAAANSDFPGYTNIGMGCEQTVYRSGSKVLKLLRLNDSLNVKRYEGLKPHDIAEKLQTETDRCRDVLGSRWLPTDFDVITLPSSGEDAVVSHQPYIASRTSFDSTASLVADRKVTPNEKHDFADELRGLHAETGLHADILGQHNIFVASDQRLAILDTIPMDAFAQKLVMPDYRTHAEHTEEQLDHLLAA